MPKQDEQKEIVKQALKEWLDEKLAQFGWFTIKALMAIFITVTLGLWLYMQAHKIP